MFERFTDQARQVVFLAREEARLHDHRFIGTEHILLGLIRDDAGPAIKVLHALGITSDDVRREVEGLILGVGYPPVDGPIKFTPRAQKVLEHSLRVSLQMVQRFISPEHILLGLVLEGGGIAARALTNLGADVNRVRQQIASEQLSPARDLDQPREVTVAVSDTSLDAEAEAIEEPSSPASAIVADVTDGPPALVSVRVFISYRREDTSHVAGRISDWLINHLGEDQVFMDVDSIELGVDFKEVITNAVGKCDTLLAVIGQNWITACDQTGKRRLSMINDIVRLEIEAALKRNIRVIPVLVDGAELPKRQQLPKSLAALARRNALRIRHESFRLDVQRLIGAVEQSH